MTCEDPRVLRYVNTARRGGVTVNLRRFNLTAPSANFGSDSLGKPVTVVGAGIGGTDLFTTISALDPAFRYVDLASPALTTIVGGEIRVQQLDLNDSEEVFYGPGLDLGSPGLSKTKLDAPSVDGEYVASSKRNNAFISMPLNIAPQETWAAIEAIYQGIVDEIEQETHEIEFVPQDGLKGYVMATYRSEVLPTMFAGQVVTPDKTLFVASLQVVIERQPWMRGAGVHV